MKIQNLFSKGTVQKDLDSRFVDGNELIDAENFIVNTTEGSSVGTGKNVTGNVIVANHGIVGGKTIGHGSLASKNKLYNFVAGDNFDSLFEYDTDTGVTVRVLQAPSGGVLNFNKSKRIKNVNFIIDPEGQGDLILWSGDHNPPRIVNINIAKTWAVNGFSEQQISVSKAPPLYPPTIVGVVSQENVKDNYLEDRFLSFAYRYKFEGGHYSAISTWSEYFFQPSTYKLDFETFENLGMKNIFNACDITFNTGPKDVVGVELFFKLSDRFTPFLIDKFIKSEEGWADNSNQTIQFNNSKVYSILPESQFYRNFDNVPLQAEAQAVIGNRVAYANYLEQRDLVDKNGNKVVMDYTLSLVENNITNKSIPITESNDVYNSVTISKGKISLNFTGVSFKAGNTISINFNLKGTVDPKAAFKTENIYTLPVDYANFNDFFTNSGFVQNITSYIDYFINNGGTITPVGYVGKVVERGFVVTSGTNSVEIKFPIIKYEITGTPSNTFVLDYFSNVSTVSTLSNVAIATSLKSNRSYEICMIYRDAQGRTTTALTSQRNTLFIPNANAITQNQIKVTIPTTQLPPVWATTYKFGIKLNKQTYETIPVNIFFVDGVYRWIKIQGENLNKIKQGDILIAKRDRSGVLANVVKVKVLELKEQENNFLTTNATSIIEPAGLYAKVSSEGFNMNYSNNEFQQFVNSAAAFNDRPFIYIGSLSTVSGSVVTDKPFPFGSTISFNISSNYHNEAPFVEYIKTYTAQKSYNSFTDFFNEQILPDGFASTSHPEKTYNIQLVRGSVSVNPGFNPIFTPSPTGELYIQVEGTESGNGTTRRGFINSTTNIRYVSEFYVFETIPLDIDEGIYYETPEVYTITNGNHQFVDHVLTKTFNCYCQGNGVESFQVRDAYNEKKLAIDFRPTAVSEDEYRQIRRIADITYSGVYNSNTNVNKLNEFNLSLANFKDDMESFWGPIVKMRGKDTNLEVCQEDRDSIVYYGKDLLFNADGTSNLARIEQVLGQQKVYDGEYGISYHADSYDFYESTSYHTDTKRGVVVKKSNNGLFEISGQGMRSYFKNFFKNRNIIEILGRYDQYYDVYLLNIKYKDAQNVEQYVTWIYSDIHNGWMTRITFNPEDMCRVNSKFFSFKNGNIWEHNSTSIFNTFYGVESPSVFTFNFSQDPSVRKIYKTIETESTDSWETTVKSDLNKGYIRKADFENKEGVFYSYIRGTENQQDTSLLNYQGVGSGNISGNTITFGFELNDIISVGDKVVNQNMQVVGTIVSKTSNSLTLNAIANLSSGNFVMVAKSESIEAQGVLGYHLVVTMSLTKNTQTYFYAANSEVIKSFM